jgi:hypothetical protein
MYRRDGNWDGNWGPDFHGWRRIHFLRATKPKGQFPCWHIFKRGFAIANHLFTIVFLRCRVAHKHYLVHVRERQSQNTVLQLGINRAQ